MKETPKEKAFRERLEYWRENPSKMPGIMAPFKEAISPIDGEHLTSRDQHREHMKKHDVICVGDDNQRKRERENAENDS